SPAAGSAGPRAMSREKPSRSERRLSQNERELWTSVTRAVAPLRTGPPTHPDELCEPPAPPHAPPAPASPKPREKPVAPLARLDRRLRQRLVRGRADVDGRIDLHGRTQAEAHDALVHFLRTRRAEGARVVLVITGKGTRGVDADRGILRRQVPL